MHTPRLFNFFVPEVPRRVVQGKHVSPELAHSPVIPSVNLEAKESPSPSKPSRHHNLTLISSSFLFNFHSPLSPPFLLSLSSLALSSFRPAPPPIFFPHTFNPFLLLLFPSRSSYPLFPFTPSLAVSSFHPPPPPSTLSFFSYFPHIPPTPSCFHSSLLLTPPPLPPGPAALGLESAPPVISVMRFCHSLCQVLVHFSEWRGSGYHLSV